MNQSNKALREIEIPFKEQKKIFKFLEDYATNPSNSNKYRYGLIGYLQDELLPALVTNHIKGKMPERLNTEKLYNSSESYRSSRQPDIDEGYNQAIDEVQSILEEISNDKTN